MSFVCLSWSIKKEVDTPTTKLVLLLLANYADEKNSCFPSEKHLAKLVGVSDRTIRRSLRYLIDNGFLFSEARKGTSNRYFLRVDTGVLPLRSQVSAYTKDKQKGRSKNVLAG